MRGPNNTRACKKCVHQFTQYKQKLVEMRCQLQQQVNAYCDLEHKYKLLQSQLSNTADLVVQSYTLPSDDPDPSQLRLSSFGNYVDASKSTHVITNTILDMFLSQSHKRKEKAASTHNKWHLW